MNQSSDNLRAVAVSKNWNLFLTNCFNRKYVYNLVLLFIRRGLNNLANQILIHFSVYFFYGSVT